MPITVFVDKRTGEPLRDARVLERIVAAVEKEGADAWFHGDPRRSLYRNMTPSSSSRSTTSSTSGSNPAAPTRSCWSNGASSPGRPHSTWRADQHRGWFQSSLLESCGTRGRAPYDAVLTHGFFMAEDGQKMSKSRGNFVTLQAVVDKHGADVLRLWVVASDYSDDLRIGPEILKQNADAYRRLRNTLRYLLGSLSGFDRHERLPPKEMPELERWVLHRLWHSIANCAKHASIFNSTLSSLNCTHSVPSIFPPFTLIFARTRSTAICRKHPAPRARTVLDALFDCLTAWLAPFLCFTAEEAWFARNPGSNESVHLRLFPEISAEWRDDALAERWSTVRRLRRVITGALEVERAAKRIGSSLQAHPRIWGDASYREAAANLDIAELAITSAASFAEGVPPDNAFRLPEFPGSPSRCNSRRAKSATVAGRCFRRWVAPSRIRRCAAAASRPSSCTGPRRNDCYSRLSPALRVSLSDGRGLG